MDEYNYTNFKNNDYRDGKYASHADANNYPEKIFFHKLAQLKQYRTRPNKLKI